MGRFPTVKNCPIFCVTFERHAGHSYGWKPVPNYPSPKPNSIVYINTKYFPQFKCSLDFSGMQPPVKKRCYFVQKVTGRGNPITKDSAACGVWVDSHYALSLAAWVKVMAIYDACLTTSFLQLHCAHGTVMSRQRRTEMHAILLEIFLVSSEILHLGYSVSAVESTSVGRLAALAFIWG